MTDPQLLYFMLANEGYELDRVTPTQCNGKFCISICISAPDGTKKYGDDYYPANEVDEEEQLYLVGQNKYLIRLINKPTEKVMKLYRMMYEL